MRASKIISIGILLAWLTGCAMFSGEYTKTAVVDSQGNAVTNLFGMPVYNKSRTARSVAIVSYAADAAAQANPTNRTSSCNYLSAEQVIELTATGQGEYFRSVGGCQMMAMTTGVVDSAMNRPGSEAEAIMREASRAVQYSEDGMTKRVAAVANPLAVTIGIRARERTAQKAAEYNADIVSSVAENAGATTVGNISVSTSQNPSADSNDGGSASGGELAGGVGGSGSGVASAEREGDNVTFIIGDRNNSSLAQDDGAAFTDSNGSQNLETSANGAVNNESNVDQQPVIDEQNESTLNNDPENGSNNTLF